jgi:dCMP deaminase
MKPKFLHFYMDCAIRTAQLSYAQKMQVGAVIVKNSSIISFGYNGMPAGWPNECETRDYMSADAGGWLSPDEINFQWPFTQTLADQTTLRYRLKSYPEVLHAERNALDKITKGGGIGSDGASMFCTHSPCLECAKSIYGAGITAIYYRTQYKSPAGIEFLRQCKVFVEQLPEKAD